MEKENTIIARVNEVRRNNGVSVNNFAKIAGVDRAYFSKQLKGERNLTQTTLYKISKAFNVSLDWLEKGIGDMMCPETQEFLQEENENEKKKDDEKDDESAIRELVSEIKKQNEVMKQQNEVLVQQLNASQEQIKMLLDIIAKK